MGWQALLAAALHAGWRALTPGAVLAAFEAAPKLRRIAETVRAIHERGEYAAVLSMSPDFFVGHFAGDGFDEVIGSRFPSLPFVEELDQAGILAFEDKPRLVSEVCGRLGIDADRVVAYGDSQSDVSLFARAAVCVAVNADHHVSRLASVSYDGDDLYAAYQIGCASVDAW